MGKVIARLRKVYQTARAEAVPKVEDLAGEGAAVSSSCSEVDVIDMPETKGRNYV